MPKPDLEAQLAALTQEFVGRMVAAIRNASFVEVAALSTPRVVATHAPAHAPTRARRGASPKAKASPANGASKGPRQTAARRAEIGERLLKALGKAAHPLGVRALSVELGVAPDLLAVPLKELRAAGRVHKHGEKRNTTYSAS
jgi:hypothetical protein